MDIGTLRELRQHLIDYTEYLPPDAASDTIWEQAVERAEKAEDRLDDLGPVLALLDAIDALTARLDQIEESLACGGCGQAVAWTCPHCGWANAGAPGIEGAHWEEDLLERSNHDR